MPGYQIVSTYTSYKIKERRWTQWLVETAEKAGYNILDGVKPNRNKNGIPSTSHAVSWKDLTSLAKSIVNGKPPQPIPEPFRQLLRDVISQRKEAASFYKTRAEDDEGHSHYVKVLEDVLKTLNRGMFESRPRATTGSSVTTQKETKPSNVFDILEIEDVNLNDADSDQIGEEDFKPGDSSDKENAMAKKPSRNKTSKKSNGKRKGKKALKPKKSEAQALAVTNPITDFGIFTPKREYEIMDNDDEEELRFRIYCFFLDFNKIREWLQEHWCDYQDGLCGLVEIAVATNTAYDMFQKLEHDLLSEYPGLEFKEIAHVLFLETGLAHVDYAEQRRNRKSEQEEEEDISADWDWLCLETYHTLEEWLEFAPPRKVPTGKWHSRGPESADVPNYQAQGRRGKALLERGLIKEFMAECCLIKGLELRKDFCLPAEDELTRGAIQMLHCRAVPMWLVFAFKVYCDQRLILESNVAKGQRDLLALAKSSKPRLQGHLDYLAELGLGPNRFVGNRIAEIDCWMISDWAEPERTELHVMHNEMRGESPPEVEEFFFYKKNPVQCGLLGFSNLLTMNEVGLNVANQFGAVLAAAHLYNAVRQETSAFPVWQDMEVLVIVHGQKRIFWDGIPTSPQRYLDSYDLSTGVSSMIARKNQRGRIRCSRAEGCGIIQPPNAKTRGLAPVSVVSYLFHERYCFGRKSMEAGVPTLPDVEKVLNHMAQNEIREHLEGLQQLSLPPTELDPSKRRAIADRQQTINSSLTQQFQKSRALTSIQLLDTLWARISQERMTLAFDYLSMHQRCTHLLRSIHVEFKSEIDEMNGSEVKEDEGMLPVVPYLIFKMMEEGCKWGSRREIAERMAKVMRTVVEQEGNKEILAVRSVMMGLEDEDE